MGDENRKTELLVGLFLLVGLLLLGALILQFSSVSEALKPKYELSINFPSAAGLVQGAPVKLGGATIGEVARKPRLNATFNGVAIDVKIFSEYQVPEGSDFVIATSGLMGDRLLEIRPPDPEKLSGAFIPHGAVLEGKGTSGLGAIEDAAVALTTKTEAVLEGVEEAIELLAEAVRNLDAGFLKEENAESFKQSLSGLSGAIATINEEILSEKNVQSVEAILSGFSETTGSLRAGADSFGEAMQKLSPVVDKIEPSVEKMDVALTRIGDAADSFGETAEVIGSKVAAIEEGDGLLAALLADEKLREEFVALISNLRRHGILKYKDGVASEATAAQQQQDVRRFRSRPHQSLKFPR
jgi:ABC-type transporter Mla subunit MlaD